MRTDSKLSPPPAASAGPDLKGPAWLDLHMKNRIFSIAFIFLIYAHANALAKPELPEILISTESIITTTDDLFYDGKISIDIDGDGNNDGSINYAYSRLGPTGTCTDNSDCAPETKPIITFYIVLHGKNIPINFMCESIGIYASTTNQRRNLFCGPKTKLYWNGQEYTEGN